MPRNFKFLPTLSNVKIHNRGYLPHWTAPDATYSITFRLTDAVAPGFIQELLEHKKALARMVTGGLRKLTMIEAMEIRTIIEHRLDEALDRNEGSAHMLDPRIASVVATALNHFSDERYELIAWTVMPNHVHAVVRPLEGYDLSTIVHSWKSWSANEANKILKRRRRFWQREYFDRIIRDEDDLTQTIGYVVANPVRAGLVNWEWVWSAAPPLLP